MLLFGWFKRKQTAAKAPQGREPIYHWSDDEIPRYPPFMKGLPAVPPERLLETQAELIERIKDAAITSPQEFNRFYMPAIERFARFAHLLPASQSHHHRGAGGLLRHSLEVGLWALQAADKVLLDAKTPLQRREMEPRWQFAVFVSGLCHDAGKPVTDLVVSNRDRSAVWKPIKDDLYDWAVAHKVDAYFIEWREGRSRQHTALSNLVADRIVGIDALEWVEESGTELVVWLMESLANNPSPTNPIHDLVIRADQASVERDLKTLGVAMAGYDLGVPVERHITDIMRRFIKEGVWLVNEPGARLWKIGEHLYLVWPAAGEEIARQVREDGIPGIPRTPDGILDMLVERKIAFVREDAAPGDRLWKIAPAILAEKNPNIKLTAIRLRDEAMVSSLPIPSVEGRIVEDEGIEPSAESESPADSQDVAVAAKEEEIAAPVVVAEAPSAKEAPEIVDVAPVIANAEETAPKKASPKKPERSAPRIIKKADEPKPDHAPAIVWEGAIGEALKALAQDLHEGAKRWGIDAVVDGECVLLRWPDAFKGYGLAPKSILDDLNARGWLWIDPMAPLKKVTEGTFSDGPAKAIRLTNEVSAALVREAKVEGGMPQTAPAIAPVEKTDAVPAKKQEDAPAERASEAPSAEKPEEKKEDAKAANEDDRKQEEPDLPSVDDVIAALRELPATALPGGYLEITKQAAFDACKKHGLRVSHRLFWVLGTNHPDRFSVQGGNIRFKP